jgi:TatD DNase family protein
MEPGPKVTPKLAPAMRDWRDAHNHLQDERFAGTGDALVWEADAAGVKRMVVNGSCEADWPAVARLAAGNPAVLPSFGLHPWYLGERTQHWRSSLVDALGANPRAGVGEIGIDGWLPKQPARIKQRYAPSLGDAPAPSLAEQTPIFLEQLELAAEMDRPATIHCLGAFGRLLELLQGRRTPARGFLLHSYGGPVEMVPAFAGLGAYFSFAGYFGREGKELRRAAFRAVPQDRLLVETDAPDQLPPEPWIRSRRIRDGAGNELHHPANLPAVGELLAEVRGETPDAVAARTNENFLRLFGL